MWSNISSRSLPKGQLENDQMFQYFQLLLSVRTRRTVISNRNRSLIKDVSIYSAVLFHILSHSYGNICSFHMNRLLEDTISARCSLDTYTGTLQAAADCYDTSTCLAITVKGPREIKQRHVPVWPISSRLLVRYWCFLSKSPIYHVQYHYNPNLRPKLNTYLRT